MAAVVVSRTAQAELDDLPLPIRGRIVRLFERLREWPAVSGAKPLSGGLAGHWRLRTGDYRLQFRLEGDTVIVERIGHRDGFYDG
jgi:mRNA interferase RelE/StbE